LTISDEDADKSGSKFLDIGEGDLTEKEPSQKEKEKRRRERGEWIVPDELKDELEIEQVDVDQSKNNSNSSSEDNENQASDSNSSNNQSTSNPSKNKKSTSNTYVEQSLSQYQNYTSEQLKAFWLLQLTETGHYKIANYYKKDFIITTDVGDEDEGLVVAHIKNISDVSRCTYKVEVES